MNRPVSTETMADDTLVPPTLLDLAIPLAERWRLLVAGSVAAALLALAITFAVQPTFSARVTFLPPQQQQSSAMAALASLGALSSLVGNAAGSARTPADQYVALLKSTTVADRLVDRFKLMEVYETPLRFKARDQLADNVRIGSGKKDGLITVEVDDHDPARAANIANQYVDELRTLTSRLALTEAQERRQFFERELALTRDRLTKAQTDLQASGFNEGTLRAEPKSAAEGYARLRAELTAAEVRLQSLRRNLADSASEVQQQRAAVGALRGELDRLEASSAPANNAGYIGKFREFKYQEALFELFARQYESARLDESREGGLIQVVDPATVPEAKSRPRRALVAAASGVAAFMLLAIWLIGRHFWTEGQSDPVHRAKAERLRSAWRLR